MEEGDIPKLELLVLQGKSHLLEGRVDKSEATQTFLGKVPELKQDIKVTYKFSCLIKPYVSFTENTCTFHIW